MAKIINRYGNIFENVSENTLFCQCISADMEMGKGIATQFNESRDIKEMMRQYWNKASLQRLFQKSGGFCIYLNGVYNLVTKEAYWQKPNIMTLGSALADMTNCIRQQLKVVEEPIIIRMPHIGCGLDKLDWEQVKPLIEKMFVDLPVVIECWDYRKQKSIEEEKQSSMELYTGYFANSKKYMEMGYYPVSIAKFTPKQINCGRAEIFAPSKELLDGYKAGKIDEAAYEKYYFELLSHIAPRIWNAFLQFYTQKCRDLGLKGIVLMCYEKEGDFCHRNLFAQYVNQCFQWKMQELKVEKQRERTPESKKGERTEEEIDFS